MGTSEYGALANESEIILVYFLIQYLCVSVPCSHCFVLDILYWHVLRSMVLLHYLNLLHSCYDNMFGRVYRMHMVSSTELYTPMSLIIVA